MSKAPSRFHPQRRNSGPGVRALIVGLGQAGARFVRACMAMNTGSTRVVVMAGVDVGKERCNAFENGLAFPCFGSIEEAASKVAPDIVIVTAAEDQHFQVLMSIRRCFPRVRRVLCEKPLTSTLREAHELARHYGEKEVSVNFVERFSPIVTAVRRFMQQRRRTILRANCFWGKYRVKDARPTLGVISVELAHPVDLVLMLARVDPGTHFKVASAVASRSNFDVGEQSALPLDTVHASLEFASGLQMIVSTSLLWAERQRKIELTLADCDGNASELAVLTFDKPMWDLDRLDIYEIRQTGGRPDLIETMNVDAASWNTDRLTIGKVCAFLESNLGEVAGDTHDLVPRLSQATYVQEVLECIEEAANVTAMSTACYVEPRTSGAVSLSAHVHVLARIADGVPIDGPEYIWDHPY